MNDFRKLNTQNSKLKTFFIHPSSFIPHPLIPMHQEGLEPSRL